MQVAVILKERIEGLGAEGDLVTLRAGYARNFLLPRGLAVLANSATQREIQRLKEQRLARERKEREEAQELVARLAAVELVFELASETGGEKVFGSVTTTEIAQKLQELGITIDRRSLRLEKPIRALGEYEVPVSLHAEVQGTVRIKVRSPQAPKEKGEGAKAKQGKASKGKKATKPKTKKEKGAEAPSGESAKESSAALEGSGDSG
jgi:large subunit ribosomal protein L9